MSGKVFNHDDTVNDRSPDSKLSKSFLETRELWRKTYSENFSMYGAMYRGSPLAEKLHRLQEEDIFAFSTKHFTLKINKVSVEGMTLKGKINLQVKAKNRHSKENIVCKLKGTESSWTCSESLPLDTLHHRRLTFELFHKKGFSFIGKSLGKSMEYDMSHVDSSTTEIPLDIKSKIGLYNMDIKGHISAPTQGKIEFSVQSGQYETTNIPAGVQQLWGLVPPPPNAYNNCNVATHRVINHTGKEIFTCRILHSTSLLMSAIHVNYHDQMTAVAHIIGSDQLPLTKQVGRKSGPKCPSIVLDPAAGERAILIK